MRVLKRNGNFEDVDFNKITRRIQKLIDGVFYGEQILDKLNINSVYIAKDVCTLIVNDISTHKLDEFSAEICVYKVGDHIDYGKLASRILISCHHKNTKNYSNFSDMVSALYYNTDTYGKHNPLVNIDFYNTTIKHKTQLDEIVNKNHMNDYLILDYFSMKTLQTSYFLKCDKTQERYQHLLMRQALCIHGDNIDEVIHCYNYLTNGCFTHATPTLFNAGTNFQQLSSCFLVGVGDSIESMYECIKRCAIISKWAGGIGLHISNIRANGSEICGTNGKSKGIMDYIRVLNNVVRHVDQGGGKRNGAIAIYLEPWHADIFDFIEAKLPNGLEESRARDLFYGLWIPDIFMKRVKLALELKEQSQNSLRSVTWSLMCPNMCKGLSDTYGEQFEKLYEMYERDGKFVKQIDILQLWDKILTSQKETGTPYICYKDHVNNKSAQKNIGIIKSSNLCTEIMEYSDENEYGTCNLASINLKKIVKDVKGNPYIDYSLLIEITKQLVRNLNNIIDINKYPLVQTEKSNFRHRPIGIGVQGLADVFILLKYPYESTQAQELNKLIFETIYYASIYESCKCSMERCIKLDALPEHVFNELKILSNQVEYLKQLPMNYEFNKELICKMSEINNIIDEYNIPKYTPEYSYMNYKYKGAYSTFDGSPASCGELQYDMWKVEPSGKYDFNNLKQEIKKWGLRNSLLVAIMPTATTAHILGNIECIEPLNSNMYTRQTLAGSFIVVNSYLQQHLTDIGLWNKDVKDQILNSGGSIQNINSIPDNIKELYKTCWEMKKKTLINMARDRQVWIDQGQSFNLFITNPTSAVLQSIHLYTWECQLKTGMYYLRRKTHASAQKFTTDVKAYCTKDNKDCASCSS